MFYALSGVRKRRMPDFFVPQIGRGVILFGEKCCFFCWLVFFFISFGMKL